MNRTAFRFILVATACLLAGLVFGIAMAAGQDHALSPAHGHLNLVGWVGLFLAGLFYQCVPAAAQDRLSAWHLATAVLGVVLLVPGIVIALTGGGEIVAIAGSFVTLAANVLFALIVWRARPDALRADASRREDLSGRITA